MVDTQGDLYGASVSSVSKTTGRDSLLMLKGKTVMFPFMGNSSEDTAYTYKETIECIGLNSTGSKKSVSCQAFGYTAVSEPRFVPIISPEPKTKLFPLVRIALETKSCSGFYVITAASYYLGKAPYTIRADCYGCFPIRKSDFSVFNNVSIAMPGTGAFHYSDLSPREVQAIYDGTLTVYGTTSVSNMNDAFKNIYKTQFDDFQNGTNHLVYPANMSIGKIIKLNGDYWMREMTGSHSFWEWIKISSTGLVYGFNPSIYPEISDELGFQYNGKTYVLLGAKTTGDVIKNNKFPSAAYWEDQSFAPWGMSSNEFCIFSCKDIDQSNPTNPMDCFVSNRIYTCKHDQDDLRFTVCQRNNIPYLIYLALPYDANTQCYKLILGVAKIKLHESHICLGIKREFTNKNGESTLPITNCKSVTNFAVDPNGNHLWIVYQTSDAGTPVWVGYIYIDANEILKRAVPFP